eukprot:UN31307
MKALVPGQQSVERAFGLSGHNVSDVDIKSPVLLEALEKVLEVPASCIKITNSNIADPETETFLIVHYKCPEVANILTEDLCKNATEGLQNSGDSTLKDLTVQDSVLFSEHPFVPLSVDTIQPLDDELVNAFCSLKPEYNVEVNKI